MTWQGKGLPQAMGRHRKPVLYMSDLIVSMEVCAEHSRISLALGWQCTQVDGSVPYSTTGERKGLLRAVHGTRRVELRPASKL